MIVSGRQDDDHNVNNDAICVCGDIARTRHKECGTPLRLVQQYVATATTLWITHTKSHYSVFKMCRVNGGRSTARESHLAIMEPGNPLLRASTTTQPHNNTHS